MAIDSIFLDSGVLRAYIDRRDRVHERVKELVQEYRDLNCRFYTTTVNISELSFWLDKSRARYGMGMEGLNRMVSALKLTVNEIGSKKSQLVFQEWLHFLQFYSIGLDFTDFYFYTIALQKSCDYLMTTDRRDFSKILALAPNYSFAFLPIRKRHFTHDNIIFV